MNDELPPFPKQGEQPGTPPVARKVRGVWMGVFWGGCMFIVMTLIPTWRTAQATGHWNWSLLVIGAAVWSFGGLAFGWIMSVFLTRQARRVAAKSAKDPLKQ